VKVFCFLLGGFGPWRQHVSLNERTETDLTRLGVLTLRYDDDFRDQWTNVETVKGVFNRISERVDVQIKVAERLRTLFGREIVLDWERGKLQVHFSRGGEEYSGDRESSGLLHLVGILSALYDDSLDAVLIDEPDISLHPQLQSSPRTLLGHVQRGQLKVLRYGPG